MGSQPWLAKIISSVFGFGELLREIETPLATGSRGGITLQLKRRWRSSIPFVVLRGYYPSRLYYCPMSAEEFDTFAGNVQLLLNDLHVMARATGNVGAGVVDGVATSWRRIMSVEALRTIDTMIWGGRGRLSLRLKRDPTSSELYVVLGGTISCPLSADEFEQFARAVKEIRKDLGPLVHPSLQPQD